MFRIKTDIRQYKCETKDKVEKLIRNWVIRPTDLIYSNEQKEWLPIGEHPSFLPLFGVLDEQERNTPDTVVTSESPYRAHGPTNGAAGPGVLADGEAGEADSPAPDEEPEEVTHIVDRATLERSSDAEGDEGEAVAPQDDDLASESADRAAHDDGDELATAEDSRKTDIFDQDDIARTLHAEPHPAPPSAPEGVEPPAKDEVTTMTERTLEMLKITDEGDEAEQADGAEVDEAIEIDEPDAHPEPISDPGETPHSEDEVTDVRNKASVKGSPNLVDGDDELAAESSAPEAVSGKKRLGRHDLPEELFATNEISAPEVREKLEKMDELGELSEPSETTNKQPVEKNGEGWNPRLHEDSGVDEAWGEIAENVPAGSEASAPEDVEADDALDDAEEELDEIDELEAVHDDEDIDEEWDEDTGEPHIDPRDFVSDGYKIPLPFQVGPTPDDVRRGLKVSRASRARKDRTYPVPEPKKLNELHRRVFDLTPTPPRDQTGLIVAVVIIFIALIVSLVSC